MRRKWSRKTPTTPSRLTIRKTIRRTNVNGVKGLTSRRSNCTSWNRRLAVIDTRTWARERRLQCGQIWRRLVLGWVINLHVISHWCDKRPSRRWMVQFNSVELAAKTFQPNCQYLGAFIFKKCSDYSNCQSDDGKLEKLFTQKTHQNRIKVSNLNCFRMEGEPSNNQNDCRILLSHLRDRSFDERNSLHFPAKNLEHLSSKAGPKWGVESREEKTIKSGLRFKRKHVSGKFICFSNCLTISLKQLEGWRERSIKRFQLLWLILRWRFNWIIAALLQQLDQNRGHKDRQLP